MADLPRSTGRVGRSDLLKQRGLTAAILASVLLHAVVVGLILWKRSPPPHETQPVEAVTVELVPAEEADAHGWSRIILNAPRQPEDGRKLYEKLATKADFSSWELRFDHSR